MNFSSDLLNLNSKAPGFSIIIEGKDVTTVLDARLMSLTLTDNRGFEAGGHYSVCAGVERSAAFSERGVYCR